MFECRRVPNDKTDSLPEKGRAADEMACSAAEMAPHKKWNRWHGQRRTKTWGGKGGRAIVPMSAGKKKGLGG